MEQSDLAARFAFDVTAHREKKAFTGESANADAELSLPLRRPMTDNGTVFGEEMIDDGFGLEVARDADQFPIRSPETEDVAVRDSMAPKATI